MFTGVIKLAQIDDYITPSQSCIQPKIMKQDPVKEKATITLNDCLACSGCITSAESILIEQMSINKLIQMLQGLTKQKQECECKTDKSEKKQCKCGNSECNCKNKNNIQIIYMIISPQALLSLSKKYKLSPDCFMHIFSYFLSSKFPESNIKLVDLSTGIRIGHQLAFRQFKEHLLSQINKPLICSQCPGWVCYAQKTLNNQITELMSQIKSPQQILGRLLKKIHGVNHKVVTIMPCYDKKLQAIRFRMEQQGQQMEIKEVDLTLSSTEVVELITKYSEDDNIFQSTELIDQFYKKKYTFNNVQIFRDKSLIQSGISFIQDQTSNGYIHMLMNRLGVKDYQRKQIRNCDFQEYVFNYEGKQIKMAKCYGFRNIQKVVQTAKRNKCPYKYVEIMACPGGCFGGGGQVRHEGVKNKEVIVEFEETMLEYKLQQQIENDEQVSTLIEKLMEDKDNIKAKYKPIQKTLEQSVMNW